MPAHRTQYGATLLEALVAMLIVSLGIFSVLGIHMRSLMNAQAGIRRAQAIRLIEDLGERIHANPGAAAHVGIYTGAPHAGTAPDCSSTPCTSAQLAERDTAQWHQTVQASLGMGKAVVFAAMNAENPDEARQIGVLIGWKENIQPDSDMATQEQLLSFLQISAEQASGHSCPDEYVCHLQYLPMPRHCGQQGIC